jgi:putative oxidoreductase
MRNASIVRSALRAVIGLLFVGHGAQKLFGWFGGHGLAAATDEMEALGLRPARANAVLAGSTQIAGGALVATGALTPLGSAAIAGNMITAIRTACAGRGPWGPNGGWEYQLVLTLALLALAEGGPGGLSVDAVRRRERSGPIWAMAALAAALAGSSGAIAVGRRLAAPRDHA